MKPDFKVLSIDGGGVRGVMPATLLSLIEKEIQKPLYEYFDLVCGTSTGSIIALALSLGKPMTEIADLYDKKADVIFPKLRNDSWFKRISFAKRLVFGAGHAFEADPLERLLKDQFKDKLLRDAKVNVCVPAIDITSGRIVVYKTPHKVMKPVEKVLSDDGDKEMWRVARASSAAPIFFPSAKVNDSFCIDGGMWGNNPGMIGLIEALRFGADLDQIKILSLGTGSSIYQVESTKASRMNIENWGFGLKLIEMSFEVQSEAVKNQLNLLLSPKQYMRLDHKFPNGISMTDTSRLGDLKAAAQNLMRDHRQELIQKFFQPST